MKKLTIYIVLAVLCLNYSTQAQDQQVITALKIGDQVPDIIINNIINYKDTNGKLAIAAKISDFKGKLLILDFWATWCSACIANFPKMEALQKEFGSRLQMMGVTSDKQTKASSFLKKYERNIGRDFTIPSVVDATTLNTLFPHKIIPQYVWIDPNGIVVAITSSEHVTAENIRLISNGKTISLPLKEDVMSFNHNKPLFIEGNGGTGASIKYRSTLSGRINGVNTMASSLSEESKVMRGRIFGINCSVQKLYTIAFSTASKLPDNRILLEVRNPAIFRYLADSIDMEKWQEENTYCYELICPPTNSKTLKSLMGEDLNRYFSVKAKFEKRALNCWIITRQNNLANWYSKGEEPDIRSDKSGNFIEIVNQSIASIASFLNRKSSTPIIDESNCFSNLDIKLSNNISDQSILARELEKQGLQMTSAIRSVDVFIITDK
jgi:thiol-disulfide isomerase/thioredoxin